MRVGWILFMLLWGSCPTPNWDALADCADAPRNAWCTPDGPAAVTSAGGFGVIRAQMGQPAALPSQNIVLLLTPGLTLTDDTASPFIPPEPLAVRVRMRANLRRGPGLDAEIAGGAAEGERLLADALSPDGEWVRVAFRNDTAWISRPLLTPDPVIGALPLLAADQYGVWQALELAADDTGCDGVLLVQPPRLTEIRLRVNGHVLHLNNAVVLDILGERLRVSALDGGVRLPDGVPVPRGFSASVPLDGSAGWSAPRPMTQAQLAAYTPLADAPAALLNEPITLPVGAYIRPGTPNDGP